MCHLIKKIVSVILLILLLLGVASCTPKEPQTSGKSYEEQKALYDGVISQYTAFLTAKHDGEELIMPDTTSMDERELAIVEALYGIVDACNTAEGTEVLGYGYKDMDGNGTPELILLSKYTSVRAILTLSNDMPLLLEANYGSGTSFYLATENRFMFNRSSVTDNFENGTIYTCHVEGDKLVYDSIFGRVYDCEKDEIVEMFQMVNGERVLIDEIDYRTLVYEYQTAGQTGYEYISKLQAPLVYLPLAKDEPILNPPLADFSSYEAIKNTYIAISSCLDKFNRSAWSMGAYDYLFSFSDDRYYEYYNQLLYIAYCNSQSVGYDEIDLNGDGVDELVFLTEDYRIKAIFTKKDEVPVLLDTCVFSYHTCWLDSDGLIHVDRYDYDTLEYSLYEFTNLGEYKHQYSIIANRYGKLLMKDGKTDLLTQEDAMKLYYDEYITYSEPFDPNEWTRNSSKLTYTPIVESNDDVVKAATETTWRKYAGLEKTSGKDFARSITYVTFENVTDTKMDMNVKYVFAYSYPDPDREHYLLDDITESNLKFNVRKENGVFVFDGNGIKGKVEFGRDNLWIVIEESQDERFPVGNYCHNIYSGEIIS